MSNGDFYPTDTDEGGATPTPDLPDLDFWIILSIVFFLLLILGMGLIGMYFSSHPTPLTLPAGACVAPLCM